MLTSRQRALLGTIVEKVREKYPAADALVAEDVIQSQGPGAFKLTDEEIDFLVSRGIIKRPCADCQQEVMTDAMP